MRDLNLFSSPLGLVNPYSPMKKEWVATAIGAGAGLLSSFIGGLSASSAAREAERRQRALEAKEDAWYNRRYNEDYLDTAAGQNLVRRARQMYDRNIKRAQGAAAVTGGTDASVQQAKDSANQAMGDTIANIAASDQSRKAQVDNMHRQAESQFAQMDMNRELNRAQNITNAAQAASNAMMSAGAAVDQANTTRSDLTGGGNNSKTMAQIDAETNAKPVVSSEKSGGEGALSNISESATEDERRRARMVIGS